MKYYEYKEETQKLVSKLFEKHEMIFAFSKEQFEKQKKENTQYLSIGAGGLIPKENYENFSTEFEKLTNERTTKAKEIFSYIEIINYELGNYEFGYTGDSSDAREALSDFEFTEEQFKKAIKEYWKNYEN